MQAIQFFRYGPPEVLQLKEIPTPQPGKREVRIKIHAVAVNTGDCEIRSPRIPNAIWFLARLYFGLFRPRKRILGSYLAGVIDEVGAEVSSFKVGDPVFACSGPKMGAYAEYLCLPEGAAIAAKPKGMSFAEAAALPLGLDALHFLTLAELKAGEKLLINGAGGGIGTIALQLALYYGAEVTVVDRAEKLSFLKELGAQHVIDYKQQDFAENTSHYDVVFDLVGRDSYRRSLKALRKGGRYLLANPAGLGQMLRGLGTSLRGQKKVISRLASATTEGLLFLKARSEAGELRICIDREYPMAEVVNAHHYVESGFKKGNVVLRIIAEEEEL